MSNLKRKATALDAASEAKKSKPTVNGSITSFFGAPRSSSSSGGASAGAVNFDKKKWVEGLTAEQRGLLKLEIDTLHESWLAHLKGEVVSPEFLELKRFLKREKETGKKVFPPEGDIYSWSRHTPLHTVKAVILGQDPYHNHNQAHGLCFSVRPPTPAPPSLKNIYIAVKNDYPDFIAPPNRGGLLTPWAENGVLMLNTCLTVRAHEANSHSDKGWERFTGKVIEIVSKVRTRGVVFLAWGSPAAKRVAKVDKKIHLVLQSPHPSPLSASRGFFTCGHFKKANNWLKQKYGSNAVIDWSLTPRPPAAAAAAATAVQPPKAKAKDPEDEFPFDGEFPDEEELLGSQEKRPGKQNAGISPDEEEAAAIAEEVEKELAAENPPASSATKPKESAE
ncbi:MAG: uracil DNA glycosylase [Geoglossum umbratile]|nr:MAG: uracil DNA glycosylase [Geoglossum umbratile]